MEVKSKRFEGILKNWDKLSKDATDFATEIGRERLINISESVSDFSHRGITVWYWSE